jgi:hypothetical protein
MGLFEEAESEMNKEAAKRDKEAAKREAQRAKAERDFCIELQIYVRTGLQRPTLRLPFYRALFPFPMAIKT